MNVSKAAAKIRFEDNWIVYKSIEMEAIDLHHSEILALTFILPPFRGTSKKQYNSPCVTKLRGLRRVATGEREEGAQTRWRNWCTGIPVGWHVSSWLLFVAALPAGVEHPLEMRQRFRINAHDESPPRRNLFLARCVDFGRSQFSRKKIFDSMWCQRRKRELSSRSATDCLRVRCMCCATLEHHWFNGSLINRSNLTLYDFRLAGILTFFFGRRITGDFECQF